ncbi:MAG: 5-(carboxyamino)imidazole ribonucleotide synthase [Flavobacteriales bacterium]|nr:5-(carboxyamino)imidazole ribonucleotide synthase [Flavobacteriales bacterium]
MKIYGNNIKLGILGGGQLGRMLIQEAISLDVQVHVLDPAADAPCAGLATTFTCGSFRDYQTVLDFGRNMDVLTIEIEDVNVDALRELKSAGVKVFPDPEILAVIKDKGLQKQFFVDHGIPSSAFRLIESSDEIEISELPVVHKLRTGGYDGKGVSVLRSEKDVETTFKAPSILESLVDIEKELSVIIARNEHGQTVTYPVVEMVFDDRSNLVDYLFAPATISHDLAEQAKDLATKVADAFSFVGILAVEMFLTKGGDVLVNEVAPRTHNSGHHTIEANFTSQFAQHLRAVVGMPLGSTDTLRAAAMVNLVGEDGFSGPVVYDGLDKALGMEGVYPHFYGKSETKPFRKMGHVTILADSIDALPEKVHTVKKIMRVISK